MATEKIHYFTRNEREVCVQLFNRGDRPWWFPQWMLERLGYVHYHQGSAGVSAYLVYLAGVVSLVLFLLGYFANQAWLEYRGMGL